MALGIWRYFHSGRVIEIDRDLRSSGKTTLTLHAIANARKG